MKAKKNAYYLLFICVTITSAGCDTATTPIVSGNEQIDMGEPLTPVAEEIAPEPIEKIYALYKNGDTVQLHLKIKEDSAYGEIKYRYHGKEKDTGTLYGHIQDSTLYAVYTFDSQGKTAQREAIFRIHDSSAVEATGAKQEVNGRQIFTDSSSIEFDSTRTFVLVN